MTLRTLVLAAILVPPGAAGQIPTGFDVEEWRTDFGRSVVPFEEIVPGGPPKDGIPALDAPTFVSAGEADDWLEGREPVAVVVLGGEAKAYPLQILIWHEIVNDVVGDVPVTITFCPLCNTTLAFDRRHGDRVLDFGTTGLLRHSDMIMYDRQTETWWQQAVGEAIVGELAGDRLIPIPAPVLGWDQARDAHPDLRVLDRETGHTRRYGENPYRGYDTRGGPIATFIRKRTDRRLNAMDRVVALDEGEPAVAVPFEMLRDHRVVALATTAGPRVIFWAPGQASALDRARIGSGREVGSVAVYSPVVDGTVLEFDPADQEGRYRDRVTGTVWTLSGEAVSGPLRGRRLAAVAHSTPFWFAWVAFRPDTRIEGR